jgi:TRAP-type mannitol/chloroaromatic compound transport system permease small subunit
MRKILALIDSLSTWTGKIVSVLSMVVALVITYEIVAREVFHLPTTWAAELTVFACGLLYLLGGAWTLLQDGHVRVDILHNRFKPRTRALVDCLTYFAFVLYVSVMIWATAKYAYQSCCLLETTMTPWDPPLWPMKIAMLLALILLFLQQTAKFVRDLYFVVKGQTL